LKLINVILGPLPEKLNICIESQKRFADLNNMEYISITEIPEWGKRYAMTNAIVDRIKLEYLANENNILACDWDIQLYDNFQLPFRPSLGDNGNNFMWNGNDKEIFKKSFDELVEYEKNHSKYYCEYCRAMKILNKNEYLSVRFDNKTYKHIRWRQ